MGASRLDAGIRRGAETAALGGVSPVWETPT